jgi:Na+/H+ antiporter NhaA
MEPLARFLEIESASGILLVVCQSSHWAANCRAAPWNSFWHTEARVSVGTWSCTPRWPTG